MIKSDKSSAAAFLLSYIVSPLFSWLTFCEGNIFPHWSPYKTFLSGECYKLLFSNIPIMRLHLHLSVHQNRWGETHLWISIMCKVRKREIDYISEFVGLLVSRPYPVPYFYFKKRKWNLAPPGATILLQKKRKSVNSGFVQRWKGTAAQHLPLSQIWKCKMQTIEIQLLNPHQFKSELTAFPCSNVYQMYLWKLAF